MRLMGHLEDGEEVQGRPHNHLKTMNKTASRVAVFTVAAISFAMPAQAQYYGTYNQLGNFGNGTVTGPNGYQMNIQRSRIGNFTNDNYSDNRGNSLRCTTSQIGSFRNTSCY
jgi:hypothetical protein